MSIVWECLSILSYEEARGFISFAVMMIGFSVTCFARTIRGLLQVSFQGNLLLY